MNLLYLLDFNHDKLHFFFKGRKGAASLLGGFMTLIVGVIFVLLVIGFGSDFFYRLNPAILNQDIFPDEYKNFNFTTKNIPIAFRFEDVNGLSLDKEQKSFYFDIYYQKLNKVNGSWSSDIYNLNYSKCNESDFKNKQDFYLKDFKNAYCIDNQGLDLGGYWDGNFLNYIYINYLKCEEGSFSINGEPCNESRITNDYISKFTYLALYMQNVLYDPANYTNPFIVNLANTFYMLDLKLAKSIQINFIEYISSSDIGWIMENKISDSIISYYSQAIDYLLSSFDDDPYMRNYLGTVSFYVTKKQIKYIRLYSKVQSLAANIGGILKITSFFLGLIVHFYSNVIVDYELSNQINSKLKVNTEKKIANDNPGIVKVRANDVIKFNLNNNNKSLSVSNVKIHNNNNNINELNLKPIDLKVENKNVFFDMSSISFWTYLIKRIKMIICFCKQKQIKEISFLNEKIREYLDIRKLLELVMNNFSDDTLNEKNKLCL